MALKKHLRKTFIAGVLAAAPLVATILFIWWVEAATRQPLRDLIGVNVPFLGVAVAIVLIYLLGLLVSSLIGKWFVNRIDAILLRLPLLSELYQAWKHISVTPGGREGIFSKVVLVPADGGMGRTLGFSSGEAVESAPGACCVFIPGAPNPMNGRLIFVPLADCTVLGTSAEEAFKWILSGGNYVPADVGAALAAPR